MSGSMTKLSTCFVLFIILSCAICQGHRRQRTLKKFQAVEEFVRKVTLIGGASGEFAGKLVLNLEKGVEKSLEEAIITEEGPERVTLQIGHAKVNQGEIATPSKVPVIWILDMQTKYTLKKHQNHKLNNRWVLEVDGVYLFPFREGLDMYQNSRAQETCTSVHGLVPKVQCERAALYEWYKSQEKHFKQVDYLKNAEHKISRILKDMHSGLTKAAIKRGGNGDEAWQKILYSLVTIPPVNVKYFEIIDKNGKFEDVEVKMVSTEWTFPPLGADYEGLDFKGRNGAEFNAAEFDSQRSKGEYFARSGMNFGAMVAKGAHDEVKGATGKYILNFVSPCIKIKADKYGDVTMECKSDNGRVAWKEL